MAHDKRLPPPPTDTFREDHPELANWIWYLYDQLRHAIETTWTMTATGTVKRGVSSLELAHASVVIAATMESSKYHAGLFTLKNTSSGGTTAHTVTLTNGTWDGTNDVVTTNAPDEILLVYFDTDGNGTILANDQTMTFS